MTHHQRTLGLAEVFSIASGAMISSGLFVLPAVIFAQAGTSVVAVYLLAGLMMIPSLTAKAELATAMPKSGGTYFFVERSLGTLLGTFAGLAGWFSISLKSAFALVGLGAFWSLINPSAGPQTYKIIALCFVGVFTLINLSGVHGSARTQVVLVAFLLVILAAYAGFGSVKGQARPLSEYIPRNMGNLFQLTGMVFVSFGGLTKVAALAHEVKSPGTILPKGMFLSFFVVLIAYAATIGVTVNILDETTFSNTLTPLSAGGAVLFGRTGAIILAVAALIAFATTANAGILSASQNPAAMARDGLLPMWLSKTSSKSVPVWGTLITAAFMALVIIALDLPGLIKAASTMKLILFLLVNLSLILMRESRIVSYRPQYKAPLYPIMPILGIIGSGFLIYSMGSMPLILTGGFFLLTTLWSLFFRPGRQKRDSALFRIVERIAAREIRGARLSEELGLILRERDGVSEDRFDRLVRKAIVLDLPHKLTRDQLFAKLAGAFTLRLNTPYEEILRLLNEREQESTTLLSNDLAVPHLVLNEDDGFEVVLVRAKNGVNYKKDQPEPTMVFALAGSAQERHFHLQCLMAIAQITQSNDFMTRWMEAFDEEELRLLILLAERNR